MGSWHPPLEDGCLGLTTNLYVLILVDTWGDRAIILPVLAQLSTLPWDLVGGVSKTKAKGWVKRQQRKLQYYAPSHLPLPPHPAVLWGGTPHPPQLGMGH